MPLREYHKRWEFDLKSSPERLWPFIADTNRFNRDTGVPQIEIDSSDKRLRNARRKVRLSIYGLPVEWEEQPFEWVKPSRFGVERVYSKGPLARLKMRAELQPKSNGGTRWFQIDHASGSPDSRTCNPTGGGCNGGTW